MPKLKPGTVIPTPQEDAAITAAAMQDPDALPYTDEEWDLMQRRPEEMTSTDSNDHEILASLRQAVAARISSWMSLDELERVMGRGPWSERANVRVVELVDELAEMAANATLERVDETVLAELKRLASE